MRGSKTSALTVNVGSRLNCAGGQSVIVNDAPLAMCIADLEDDIVGFDSYALWSSDTQGNIASQNVQHAFTSFNMSSIVSNASSELVSYLYTVNDDSFTETSQLDIGGDIRCKNISSTNYTLQCQTSDNSSIEMWIVWLLIALILMVVLAGVVQLIILWHRWAIPGDGIFGILKCCPLVITSCISCMCPCLCRDIIPEPVAAEEIYPELYLSSCDQMMEVESGALDSSNKTIEERVELFGYGVSC